jgi:hypothetical protein
VTQAQEAACTFAEPVAGREGALVERSEARVMWARAVSCGRSGSRLCENALSGVIRAIRFPVNLRGIG